MSSFLEYKYVYFNYNISEYSKKKMAIRPQGNAFKLFVLSSQKSKAQRSSIYNNMKLKKAANAHIREAAILMGIFLFIDKTINQKLIIRLINSENRRYLQPYLRFNKEDNISHK